MEIPDIGGQKKIDVTTNNEEQVAGNQNMPLTGPQDTIEPFAGNWQGDAGAMPAAPGNAPEPLPDGYRMETSTNPNTGETVETIYNKAGEVKSKTTKDSNGNVIKTEKYTDNNFGGKSTETETFDGNGNSQGISSVSTDENGEVRETVEIEPDGTRTITKYSYDEQGRLDSAERTVLDPESNTESSGMVQYDDNGNAVEQTGDVEGILDDFFDHNTHTTTDANGNKVTVRHNPDGTQDVTILTPDGKTLTQKLRPGGCYLGPGCPKHQRISNNIPFQPISLWPPRAYQVLENPLRPHIFSNQAMVLNVSRNLVHAFSAISPPEAAPIFKTTLMVEGLTRMIAVWLTQADLQETRFREQLHQTDLGNRTIQLKKVKEDQKLNPNPRWIQQLDGDIDYFQKAMEATKTRIQQLEQRLEQLDPDSSVRRALKESTLYEG